MNHPAWVKENRILLGVASSNSTKKRCPFRKMKPVGCPGRLEEITEPGYRDQVTCTFCRCNFVGSVDKLSDYKLDASDKAIFNRKVAYGLIVFPAEPPTRWNRLKWRVQAIFYS